MNIIQSSKPNAFGTYTLNLNRPFTNSNESNPLPIKPVLSSNNHSHLSTAIVAIAQRILDIIPLAGNHKLPNFDTLFSISFIQVTLDQVTFETGLSPLKEIILIWNVLCYKILNLGCHNFHDNEVYMYAWDETVTSRGSQEVAYCILKHLKNLRNQKRIIAYSDMCTGQNKNIKLAVTWLKIVQSAGNNANIIDHKFLLSEHSFLPNGSDSGVIEMALRKNNLIYVPQDYYETIKTCRKSNKFILTKMKREDFFSTKPLEEAIHKRLKNTSAQPVNWLRICWMRLAKSEPYKMFHKESMEVDADFKTLDLLPCRGRSRNFNKIKLTPLYKNVRPKSTPKYKVMMELLRNKSILMTTQSFPRWLTGFGNPGHFSAWAVKHCRGVGEGASPSLHG
uniref:Uncharacterized protein n=1 Tax=Glossina morsitans morsitans TaxID=37546 RepID=A0A1B0FA47_GLOMM